MDEELLKLKAAFEEKMKAAATKTEIEVLKADFSKQIAEQKAASPEDLAAAKTELENRMKAMSDKFEADIAANAEKSAIKTNPIEAAFKGANLINEDGSVKFDARDTSQKLIVKAAIDMNTGNTTASVATGLQTNYGMQSQKLPSSSEVNLLDVFPSMPIAANERYMAKVVEYDETDGSGQKLETSAAGDSSFKLETEDYKIFQFGVKTRVHRNMLRTWPELQQRITSLISERLRNKIALFIIDKANAGDGTATPYGMLSAGKYTAYNETLRANEVKSATIVDVVKNAMLQSQLMGTTNEMSNKEVDTIMLNPVDVAEIESLKDANDNSVKYAGLIVDETGKLSYIHGLRVLRKKYISANTAIFCRTIGEASVELGDKQNLEIIIGYDKTEDLSKGIVTIQVESELAIGLGDPESIIYCDSISDAATALTA